MGEAHYEAFVQGRTSGRYGRSAIGNQRNRGSCNAEASQRYDQCFQELKPYRDVDIRNFSKTQEKSGRKEKLSQIYQKKVRATTAEARTRRKTKTRRVV